jgi:hypothetical protein
LSTIYHKKDGGIHVEPVSEANPFPVQQMPSPGQAYFKWKLPLQVGWEAALIFGGYAFVASDADQNDRVTGQTSFAATTPTFMLRNPVGSDVLIFPPYYHLNHTGSVAGGDIAVETEIDRDVYSSAGTSEQVRNQRFGMAGKPTNKGLMYTGATAVSSYGAAIGSVTLAPDVSPAEGVINIYEWSNPGGVLLDPATCIKIFTSAASTAPTWAYHFPWYEIPLSWF